MRHLAVFTVTVGVLAIPAFAQYPPPPPPATLAGSWTATINRPGSTITVRLDLAQNGNVIAGREQIINSPHFAVIARIGGQFTGNQTGHLEQTSIDRLDGIDDYCRQGADFRVMGPETIAMRLPLSYQCGNDEVITLTRDRPANSGLTRYPAPAPPPPAGVNGAWTATLPNLRTGPVAIRIDLTQTGTRINGHERIADTDRGIALSLNGELTGSGVGYLRETAVEKTDGFHKSCLQAADIQMTAPDVLRVHWQPSACGGLAQDITFTRMKPQPNVARNAPLTPGEALLRMLFGGDGSDTASSREQQRRDDEYQNQRDGQAKMDDDAQRQRENDAQNAMRPPP